MAEFRVGCGWDSHAFAPGRALWIGGVRLDHPLGLSGHSDGDVLLHAVCDALLGALGAGDIGDHFPSHEPRWKDAASEVFVRHARRLAREQGWEVGNLDATVILAAPRLGPVRAQLRARVAELLDTPPECISIKAKTPEGMNLEGTAMAQVCVLLRRPA